MTRARYRTWARGRPNADPVSVAEARNGQLAAELCRALTDPLARELRLHYQPIVCLRTGVLKGFEALARWRHPKHGDLRPDGFLPACESAGLMRALSRFTLRAAAAELSTLARLRPSAPPYVSVNLAGPQFDDPALPTLVDDLTRKHKLAPGTLTLEVTEAFLALADDAAIALIAQLRAAGARVQVDDFGTGHSSLARLPEFAVDGFKLDPTFTRRAVADKRWKAVASACVRLARDLGVGIVAEGLETAEQVAAAQALGCDLGQGFFFARPLPAHEAATLVGERWRIGPMRLAPAA